MVLEKTLESPLDCKEIQPVHPKGQVFGEMRMNQSCVSHLSKEPWGDHELCCLGCYLERKRPQESCTVRAHNKPRKKEKNHPLSILLLAHTLNPRAGSYSMDREPHEPSAGVISVPNQPPSEPSVCMPLCMHTLCMGHTSLYSLNHCVVLQIQKQ